MNEAIEKVLLTWYPANHPLHLNPRHPAIKLAGEAGELLDLYGKNEYKPNFSWWNCKWCKDNKEDHSKNNDYCPGWWNIESENNRTHYTPLVLDELGDLWYYLRILAYQSNEKFDNIPSFTRVDSLLEEILRLLSNSTKLAIIVEATNRIDNTLLKKSYARFNNILGYTDVTLGELTELNYIKLSDPTHNGWINAGIK